MNNKIQIGLTLIIAGMIFLVVGMVLYLATFQTTTEKVDCYDRWNNKIIGQTCLEEHGSGSLEGLVVGLLSMFMIFVGLFEYATGVLDDN